MFRGLTDKDWRELKQYVRKNCCCGGGGDPSTDPNNCLTIGSDGNLYYDCSAAGSDGNGMFSASNQGGTWAVKNATTDPAGFTLHADLNSSRKFIFSGVSAVFQVDGQGDILNMASVSSNNIYASGTLTSISLGGANVSMKHILLSGSAGQVDFPQYGLGNFVGTPAYSLGVSASGQIVEFTGAGPVTTSVPVAGQQEIPTGDITETNSDYTLPLITNIGNIQVVANPSGGGPVTVSPALGNTIEGFDDVKNKEGGMFISVSLTRWFRIRG